MIKMIKTKKANSLDSHVQDQEDSEGRHISSYDEYMDYIRSAFEGCPDVIMRKTVLDEDKEGYFIFIDGLIDRDLVQRDFINPIQSMDYAALSEKEALESLPLAGISFPDDIETIISDIMMGNTLFICQGLRYAISCNLIKFDKRSVEEPITEKNIKGSHEGFVEHISTNMTILRRRIKNPSLKFRMFKLGTTTNQTAAVAYIEDIANPSLLKILVKKIESINFDGLIDIGYIEQFLCDHPNSPFPQYLSTERPDKAVASLLEGKFIILLDGTPVVSTVPVSFTSFFQATDDYTTNWMFGTFIGIIRLFGAIIAVFLPGLYISVLSFHYYTVPLSLLISLAESRSRVPFQPVIEALIMEMTLELLREATIRLPTYIGTAVGVVGGLIIGQAAVQAGLVSNLMVIVVAFTAIASFVIPNYDMGMAIRLLRFIVMLLAAAFGVIGIVIAATTIIAHLVSLESLGQPYFSPLLPFKFKDIKDFFIRLPLQSFYTRPDTAQPVDKNRGKNDD